MSSYSWKYPFSEHPGVAITHQEEGASVGILQLLWGRVFMRGLSRAIHLLPLASNSFQHSTPADSYLECIQRSYY